MSKLRKVSLSDTLKLPVGELVTIIGGKEPSEVLRARKDHLMEKNMLTKYFEFDPN